MSCYVYSRAERCSVLLDYRHLFREQSIPGSACVEAVIVGECILCNAVHVVVSSSSTYY